MRGRSAEEEGEKKMRTRGYWTRPSGRSYLKLGGGVRGGWRWGTCKR